MYKKEFAKGNPSDMKKPIEVTLDEEQHGTFIKWKIDNEVFRNTNFKFKDFLEYCEGQAHINEVNFTLTDERTGETARYEGKGIEYYLREQIRAINKELGEDESKEDEVGINKVVELYFEDDDEVEEFKIVTTVRGNSLKNLVSIESPIGKALLGHKVGDRVWIAINDKAGYYVEIKSMRADESDEDLRKF